MIKGDREYEALRQRALDILAQGPSAEEIERAVAAQPVRILERALQTGCFVYADEYGEHSDYKLKGPQDPVFMRIQAEIERKRRSSVKVK